MKTFRIVSMEREMLDTYTCDRCHQSLMNPMDYQEALCWKNRGGFNSIFGDGQEISLDLCQDCVKTLLEPYIQFHGNAYETE